MDNIFHFIITNCLISGTLYLLFFLLFKKLTHYSLNRKYLISALFLSILLPFSYYFIDFSFLKIISNEFVETEILGTISHRGNTIMGIESNEQELGLIESINIRYMLFVLYVSVAIVFSIRLLIDIKSVTRLIRNNRKIKQGKWSLIILNTQIPTFTFFNYIFINKTDWKRNKEDINQIIKHEIVHVLHRHSWDIIFLEMVTIFLWFNPFVYLYKRSIKQIHEFHADFEASGLSNAKEYSTLLVNLAASQHSFSLVSNFSKKQLKQRIIMLNTLKSNKMTKFRYLMVLPFVISLTIIACNLAPIEANDIDKKNSLIQDASIPTLLPVALVDGVEISAGFGEMINPITKKKVMHKGVDIKAPEGTSIFATADGIIQKARYSDKGYGNLICIEHQAEMITLYAHLKDINVKVGDKVKKGDVIGTVGNTGMSTGPHIHYEVKKGDKNYDPEVYFSNFNMNN
jgi:bla regulator protein blaR1